MKCIYCLKEAEKSAFLKSEHVLPQSFGKFKNNLTLIDKVCDECNGGFGESIELALGRGTLEGISRVDYGVQNHKEFKNLGKDSRPIIRATEGPFKGAYVFREYSPGHGMVMPKPTPQVGFFVRSTREYEFFPIEKLPAFASLDQQKFEINRPDGIMMFPEHEEIAKEALFERGYNIVKGRDAPDFPSGSGEAEFEIEWTLNLAVIRAIAKIGFNYWAYWDKTDQIFEKSFDTTRQFIRYGKRPPYQVVGVTDPNRPLLADESSEAGLRRVGHIITAGWAIDRMSLVAHVSLFNRVTYPISLAAPYTGAREGIIDRGHFFNTNNHEIFELGTQ